MYCKNTQYDYCVKKIVISEFSEWEFKLLRMFSCNIKLINYSFL